MTQSRDMGLDTAAKREVRRGYLRKEDLERPPAAGADAWEKGSLGPYQLASP